MKDTSVGENMGLTLALQLGLVIQYMGTTTPNIFVTQVNHLNQLNLLNVIVTIWWELAFSIQPVAILSGTQVYTVDMMGLWKFWCFQCCWFWEFIYFSPQTSINLIDSIDFKEFDIIIHLFLKTSLDFRCQKFPPGCSR